MSEDVWLFDITHGIAFSGGALTVLISPEFAMGVFCLLAAAVIGFAIARRQDGDRDE